MRLPNLANVLVVLGLGALAMTFFLPHLTARRVARIERRALEVAQQLGNVAIEFAPDFGSEADRDILHEALVSRCSSLGHPTTDLPQIEPGNVPTFGTRHYLFQVVREPVEPGADAAADEGAEPPPIEVYAWPRTLLPPGRSVFFFPERGFPAFTRNLSADYEGLDRRPPPGAGQPAKGQEITPATWTYQSDDDERWIRVAPHSLQPIR